MYAAGVAVVSALPAFAADPKAPSAMDSLGSMVPMLLFMFFIIYFLMIRPEQKKQKERLKLLESIKKGDKVMTAAGMYGIVDHVKESTIIVKIAENTKVEFGKSAIVSIMGPDGEKPAEAAAKTDKDKK
jgi:preprotein translocase subunit YajC